MQGKSVAKSVDFVADTNHESRRHRDMICVVDFHDLCPRLSLWGSFGEVAKLA